MNSARSLIILCLTAPSTFSGSACSVPPVAGYDEAEQDISFRSGGDAGLGPDSAQPESEDVDEIDLQSVEEELDVLLSGLEAAAASDAVLARIDLQKAEELLTLLRSSPAAPELEARYDALQP